jgi:hypothetical protein
MSKFGYLIVLAGALVIIDAVLIVSNRKLNRQNQLLRQTVVDERIETLNKCQNLDCFNTEFLTNTIDEINLVMLVPAKTCLSSSEFALDFLARHDKLRRFTKVIFVGPYFDPAYQQLQEVDYKTLDQITSVFDDSFVLIKPTFLVMDKHNAHLVHEITPDEAFIEEKMQAFWAGAEQFFADVYDKNKISVVELDR